MVYDDARQRIVMFGGLSGTGAGSELDDTWEYDGTDWTQVVTPTSPPGRGPGGGLAYDSGRQRVVMRGGGIHPSLPPFDDTWEYDGTTWTSVAAAGPSARTAPAMTYDRARGHTLLFGGGDWNPYFGETWTYDGATWTELMPTMTPSNRQSARMVYDSARSVAMLFGGDDGTALNDLWEWDGTDWTELSIPGPPARCCFAFAHDKKRRQAVMFAGGFFSGVTDETWVLGE